MSETWTEADTAQLAKWKRRAKRDALASGDHDGYIYLHERPDRLLAFTRLPPLRDREWWRLLGLIWTDTEYPHVNLDVWTMLLSSKRSGREEIMSPDDRAALAAMPAEFAVYRGYCSRSSDWRGLSWTLKREIAEWFARRAVWFGHDAEPTLASGTVARADVIAYFTGRQESEVVVLPESVRDCVSRTVSRTDEN